MKFNLLINLNEQNVVQLGIYSTPELTEQEIYQTLQTAFESLKERDFGILVNVMFCAVEILRDQPTVIEGLLKALSIIAKEGGHFKMDCEDTVQGG